MITLEVIAVIAANEVKNIQISNYKGLEKKELVKNKEMINQNIDSQKFNVIDARSKERFEGKVSEPRKGLRLSLIHISEPTRPY